MPCETRKPPEEIHDLPTLQSRVVERLREAFRDEALHTFFVAIDGLPGTGKSTIVEKLAPAFGELDGGMGHVPISVDDFLATNRDSPLHRIMTKTPDPAIFWKLFYFRGKLEYILWQIACSHGEALNIPLLKTYNPRGTIPDNIHIPAGRKVVTVEGVNASEIVRDLFPKVAPTSRRGGNEVASLRLGLNEGDWPFATVMVSVDPAIALLRAVDRDVSEGLKTAVESYDHRRKEYRYMVPQIEKNQAKADFVFVNGHDARKAVSTVSMAPRMAGADTDPSILMP